MDEVPPILVVEDDAMVMLVIAEALRDGGYTVVEASDGASALRTIGAAETLRGLVTDIRIGGGSDGWEVARQARQKFAALAVVYVSGDSVSDWPANGVPQSAVLQKPFACAELVAALANLLVAQQSTPFQQ